VEGEEEEERLVVELPGVFGVLGFVCVNIYIHIHMSVLFFVCGGRGKGGGVM
jgi:hypothetical protein